MMKCWMDCPCLIFLDLNGDANVISSSFHQNCEIVLWKKKENYQLKSVQVMVRLHIFPIFSFLAKMLSFLSTTFLREMKISVKISKRTITWTDFINDLHTIFNKIGEIRGDCVLINNSRIFKVLQAISNLLLSERIKGSGLEWYIS